MCILKGFEEVSGLKINFHKSNVYGVGVSNGEVEVMASLMKCKAGKLPFLYLGLPISASLRKKEDWAPVNSRKD